MSKYINLDNAMERFEKVHGNESELLSLYNADCIMSFFGISI